MNHRSSPLSSSSQHHHSNTTNKRKCGKRIQLGYHGKLLFQLSLRRTTNNHKTGPSQGASYLNLTPDFSLHVRTTLLVTIGILGTIKQFNSIQI